MDEKNKQLKNENAFKTINPNLHSSGALARERFKRALSLNPAESPEGENLRQRLTEHEEQV